MALLIAIALLVVLDVLALRYGHDSRGWQLRLPAAGEGSLWGVSR